VSKINMYREGNETMGDGQRCKYMPFHGGNRGSNPLGDAS
jgi:hypothetical protein